MIEKTPEEKAKLKLFKSLYRQAERQRAEERINQDRIREERKAQLVSNPPILTGLLEKEHPLADDYPVYMGHLYVTAKAGIFNVVRSDVTGTIATLRRDLEKLYKVKIGEIFNCDLAKRNLL